MGGEALHSLGDQVTVWHWVADSSHAITHIPQNFGDSPGGLAFARASAYRAHRHDRLGGFDQGRVQAHQVKICAGGQHERRLVHHIFMRHIAVGKDDLIDLLTFY